MRSPLSAGRALRTCITTWLVCCVVVVVGVCIDVYEGGFDSDGKKRRQVFFSV